MQKLFRIFIVLLIGSFGSGSLLNASMSEESGDGGDGGSLAPVVNARPYTDMPPINRGFFRNTNKASRFDFHIMAQGKVNKPCCACVGGIPPECYGVARLVDTTDQSEIIRVFEMPKADKRIGRTFFPNLKHSRNYDLQIGYVRGTLPLLNKGWNDILSSNDLSINWGNIQAQRIQTPPKDLPNTSSFVFGSCNRFWKVGGIVYHLDYGSNMFQAMADDIIAYKNGGTSTDAIVTLGDWVYCDPLALGLGEMKTFKEVAELYKLTNTTSGAKALFNTRVPLYQMWDDHERWNDCTGEFPANKQNRHNDCQRAYNLYQRPFGANTPNNWFYIESGFPGFVMDLRSELLPSQHKAVSDQQFQDLKDYLSNPALKNYIKPVFMSTTALCLRGDGWSVSPKQLRKLMKFIKDNDIKGVAFFTGDIHVGVSGLWKYNESGNHPYVLEVASSAFHKISHSKDKLLTGTIDLSHNGKDGPRLSAVGGLSHITTEDHYTRILMDHNAWTIQVIRKGRHNTVLEDVIYNLAEGTFRDVLASNPLYKRYG